MTIMYMAEELDAGDIIAQETTHIDPEETVENVHDRLADLGGRLLVQTVAELAAGTAGGSLRTTARLRWLLCCPESSLPSTGAGVGGTSITRSEGWCHGQPHPRTSFLQSQSKCSSPPFWTRGRTNSLVQWSPRGRRHRCGLRGRKAPPYPRAAGSWRQAYVRRLLFGWPSHSPVIEKGETPWERSFIMAFANL